MEQAIVSRNQLVNQLVRIGHGNLSIYNQIGLRAVKEEPELFAHLIAWNEKKGEVRDSKVAFPVLALRGSKDEELFENAGAHLCKLDARNLLRACRYYHELPSPQYGGGRWLKGAVHRYIAEREVNRLWWNKTAVQHRASLKSLYAMHHIKPSRYAQEILFKRQYPSGSVFAAIRDLKNMKPQEAAGTILNFQIPFLIAVGALGGIKNKTDVVLALIERMSAAELINNTNMLKKIGVFENSELKAAYDKGIQKVAADKKVSSLKASRAAAVVGDKKVVAKLEKVQEQRLEKSGIEGDWLVLGDRSGSMQQSIEVARQVAALLARQVRGAVHLAFFNTSPTYFDVTGKSLDEIMQMTRRLNASGGTSVGCGFELIMDKGIAVNGIAICSDGGDNTRPHFISVYKRYIEKMGLEPTVYLYHVPGEENHMNERYHAAYCDPAVVQLEEFELGRDVDYYSLPNLVATMRTSRYSLVEEIMETPLLTYADVFKKQETVGNSLRARTT